MTYFSGHMHFKEKHIGLGIYSSRLTPRILTGTIVKHYLIIANHM